MPTDYLGFYLNPKNSEPCLSCQEFNLELKTLYLDIKMYFIYKKSVSSELHYSMIL